MKLLLLLALTGCTTFKRGDCVREIGREQIEKVTVTSLNGSIETSVNIKKGLQYLSVYDKVQQGNLIKLQCDGQPLPRFEREHTNPFLERKGL